MKLGRSSSGSGFQAAIGYANREAMLVLDALRKKRNINDYSGDLMDPESLRQCILEAESLMKLARARLTPA